MAKQYALILPNLYTGSMRKAGPYVLADWPWILAHMDPDGLTNVSARVLTDEIGGELVEHQKVIDWLLSPECDECRLWLVGRSRYLVANHERYKLIWQSIAEAEYGRAWDREHRPSGWQRAKAKRISPNQSDTKRHI